jgi:hypothetical protein
VGEFHTTTLAYTKTLVVNVMTPFFVEMAAIKSLKNTFRVASQASFTGEQANTSATRGAGALVPPRTLQATFTFTYRNSAAFAKQFYEMVQETYKRVSVTVPFSAASVVFQALTPLHLDASAQTGGNVLGLGDESGDLVIVLVQAYWKK